MAESLKLSEQDKKEKKRSSKLIENEPKDKKSKRNSEEVEESKTGTLKKKSKSKEEEESKTGTLKKQAKSEEKKETKEKKKAASPEEAKESKTGTLKKQSKSKEEEESKTGTLKKKEAKEKKKATSPEEEKESKTGTLKKQSKSKEEEEPKTGTLKKKEAKEKKKATSPEEEKESKTGTLKKQSKSKEEEEPKTGTLKRQAKSEEKKEAKEKKKETSSEEVKESKMGTLKKQSKSKEEEEPKTGTLKKQTKSEEKKEAREQKKEAKAEAESSISAAPEKAEKKATKQDTAASSEDLDTRETSKPKEILKDAKKLAKSDLKKALRNVKENGRKFADEVDGTMQRLVAKTEEHFLPTSRQHLIDAECYVFRDYEWEFEMKDVEVGKEASIHTICFNAKRKHRFRKRLPLVMIHGLGGGIPCFHKNYEHLCVDRKVYGIDIPGFALSSRVPFPKDPLECRNTIVSLIEQWRKNMNIKKFILLGHSFGGHIASAYTVRHSSRVRHLILADPWGIISKEDDDMRDDPVMWQKAAMCVSNTLKSNPFDVVRDTGPLGPILAKRFLPQQLKKAYGSDCSDYFYHALAQSNATGEAAFSILSDYEYLWPADAMQPHLVRLSKSVPITFIYGETSPFHNKGGFEIQRRRKNVFVHELAGVGHHVQAQDEVVFNERMFELLSLVDRKRDKCKKSK